jgi:hypothetical protein
MEEERGKKVIERGVRAIGRNSHQSITEKTVQEEDKKIEVRLPKDNPLSKV